jgi:hypothetical protein
MSIMLSAVQIQAASPSGDGTGTYATLTDMTDIMAAKIKTRHAGSKLYLHRENIRRQPDNAILPFSRMLASSLEHSLGNAGFVFISEGVRGQDVIEVEAPYSLSGNSVEVNVRLKDIKGSHSSFSGIMSVSSLPGDAFTEGVDERITRLGEMLASRWNRTKNLELLVQPITIAGKTATSSFAEYATRLLVSSLLKSGNITVRELNATQPPKKQPRPEASLDCGTNTIVGIGAVLTGSIHQATDMVTISASIRDKGCAVIAADTVTIPRSIIPHGLLDDTANKNATRADSSSRKDGLSFNVNYVYRPKGMGNLRPIKKGDILASGDHYKIIFSPDKESYVYIFQVDSAGQVFQLFPMKAFKGAGLDNMNPVKSGKTYILPAANKAFTLDKQTGLERIYFIASKEQDTELESLYAEAQQARGKGVTRNEGAEEKLKRLFSTDADSPVQTAAAPEGNQKKRFKKRGVEGIASDTEVQVPWNESGDLFSVMGQKLENLGGDSIHVLEFVHQ